MQMEAPPEVECFIVNDGGRVSYPAGGIGKVLSLKVRIKTLASDSVTCNADKLRLYLARRNNEWLSLEEARALELDPDGSIVDERTRLVQSFTLLDQERKLKDELEGLALEKGEMHVLVVVPREKVVVSEHLGVHRDTARDEDLPRAKRAKVSRVEVAYQGPVPKEFYSVPVESIDTYQRLETAFVSRKLASICLLYGPRQFGKTTIAHRLMTSLDTDPSILVIYFSLTPSTVETEEIFWLALSRTVGKKTKSSDEFETEFLGRKTRLWLALDEMDTIFQNETLTRKFMDCLRWWQSRKSFLGFLGIGSHELMKIHLKFKGGTPFNLAEGFPVKRFSSDQMSAFFKQIEERFPFQDSTRQAIMEYSSGAPGVFGSLVRYSIDRAKCNQERHEWEDWFKIQNFSNYLDTYNRTYKRIQEDLQELGQSDWDLLCLLLKDGVRGSSAELVTSRDKLLRMGVVIAGARDPTKLEFSSEMMRRLCLEALPIREIRVVATADDPLELFVVSLRFVNPESIRHVLVKNKLSPSESVFQFELFASIRGIFMTNNISDKNVLAEARDPHDTGNQRLDIIVTNGVKYGYELKADKLTQTEITAAVEQADGYRELLNITSMFMVNFVPRGHSLRPPVYSVEGYPDVKIVHVFFPDTCDEFTLEYEGANGVMESRTVRCG